MLDGVGWAALEIVVFMVAATLVGFAIGWVFVGWLQRTSVAKEYEAQLTAQQELARKAEYRLTESNTSLDKLQLELRGESEKVGELEAQLEASQATVAELEEKAEGADVQAEFAAAQSELTTTQAELATAQSELAAAQSELAATQSELATAESGLTAATADLASARSDLDTCRAESEGLTGRVGEMEASLAERDSTIVGLESALAAATAEPVAAAEPAISPVPVTATTAAPADSSPQDAPTKEEGLARIAEIAARTAGGAPAADDDLKKVHGIGPKLERTLKGLGITSFRQIANFEPDDIAFVTAALDAFKGRIERDDWMSSAASEHMSKYNEPV